MTIVIDDPAPGVRRLLINRPDKRNAINHEVRQALLDALNEAREQRVCRAIVLGGVGGVFSAGGDIASMADLDETGARERMRHIHQLCRLLHEYPLPVVSAVQGVCAGAGVGLALLGDVVLCDAKTRFLLPFLKLGLSPDWGLLHTLPIRVGLAEAKRLLTQDQFIDADVAVAKGLADECISLDVMASAISLASRMSRLPQDAFARMKRRLNQPASSLADELQREEDDQAALLLGPEFREGFAAFGERREPQFGHLWERSL